MNPTVYIILPVYNGEKYLLQQLMSIYFQDYEIWHLVIINDGCTDSTQSIIDKFISDYKLKNKVTIINQTNKGLNKSIENGLLKAKEIIESSGDNNSYIAYCDADDLMMTNKLSYQVKFMEENKEYLLSYHDLILIDLNNNIQNLSYFKKLRSPFNNVKDDGFCEFCISNHMPSTTIMFRISLIDKLLPFPEKFPFQDWWTALIVTSNGCRIKNLNLPLGFYRRYPYQMSAKPIKNDSGRYRDFIRALNEIGKRTGNEEVVEFIKFYEKKIKRTEKGNNKLIQTIKTLLLFNKISFLYMKKILLFLRGI